jgi:mannan endo-1,4-beta-mannosidase
MIRKITTWAAFAILVGAAILLGAWRQGSVHSRKAPAGFVGADGHRFVLNGKPFRFAGANAAILFGAEADDMPARVRAVANDDLRVLRVWASGESGPDDGPGTGVAQNDWVRRNPFRRGPDDWNEAAFVHLDQIIAEAERNHLLVQLCLTNWWRDSGGVVRYLDWAGIKDARDDAQPFGINVERAMLFYSNPETRRLYREHVRRVVTRRNTVTGELYSEDPTILGYELMNEAQAVTGRWAERTAWMKEMSGLVRSMDPNHLISPGTWGYRTAAERRAWIDEQKLPDIDYCDVHVYPRDDTDSFVGTPAALGDFLDNRVAAALQAGKPLVVSEFGIPPEGFAGVSRENWYRAFYDNAARAGVAGAMCWTYTNDLMRDYGITDDARDVAVRAEIKRGADLLTGESRDWPPLNVIDLDHHLVPHQFAFNRPDNDPAAQPFIVWRTGGILYQFKPENAVAGRFEHFDGWFGYVWGAGAGYFDYLVPERNTRRRIGKIIVRAYLRPVEPADLRGQTVSSRVTLYINDIECGSRVITTPKPGEVPVQTWTIDSWRVRWQAVRALPLRVRFAVEPTADLPYGMNISGWPEGFDAKGATPVEVEVD